MTDVLNQITDNDWEEFRAAMGRVVARNHFRPNVPESPEDTVQSAIRTFLRRRDAGDKRELSASTPEALKLVLLYRAWAKNRQHHHRANQVKNSAAKFGDLDQTGNLEASIRDQKATAPLESLFISEVFEQLDQLPELHRQAATLCMEGYNRLEIAHNLNCTAAEVTGILAGMQARLLGHVVNNADE